MTRVSTRSQPKLLGSSYQKLCAMLLFSILALLMPVSSGVLQAQETTIHIVKSGEYLSSIANKYNVTVRALMSYNNIKDADLIRPGQQILIPIVRPTPTPNSGRPSPIPTDRPVQNTGTPPRATKPPVTPIPSDCTAAGEPIYVVRSGDTLSSIGRQFGVPYANIAQRNDFPSSRPIAVSQRLIIPIYGVAPVTSTPTSVNPTPVPDASVPTVQLTETPAATETPVATNTPDAPTAEIPPSEVSTPEPAAQ